MNPSSYESSPQVKEHIEIAVMRILHSRHMKWCAKFRIKRRVIPWWRTPSDIHRIDHGERHNKKSPGCLHQSATWKRKTTSQMARVYARSWSATTSLGLKRVWSMFPPVVMIPSRKALVWMGSRITDTSFRRPGMYLRFHPSHWVCRPNFEWRHLHNPVTIAPY